MRSELEKHISNRLGRTWKYEPEGINYIIERLYIPDFVKNGVVVEVKGYFRQGDHAKYKAVNEAVTSQGRLFVMVLQYPQKKAYKGSKTTMAQWCTKNRIPWFSVDDLPRCLNDVEKEHRKRSRESDSQDKET